MKTFNSTMSCWGGGGGGGWGVGGGGFRQEDKKLEN